MKNNLVFSKGYNVNNVLVVNAKRISGMKHEEYHDVHDCIIRTTYHLPAPDTAPSWHDVKSVKVNQVAH